MQGQEARVLWVGVVVSPDGAWLAVVSPDRATAGHALADAAFPLAQRDEQEAAAWASALSALLASDGPGSPVADASWDSEDGSVTLALSRIRETPAP